MIKKHFGIQEYVIWLTLIPLLVMAISFGTFFLLDRSADLDRDLLTRGQLIARQLAASSEYGVFSNNRAFLNGAVASVLQQPDVKAAVILNAGARVLLAADDTYGSKAGNAEPDNESSVTPDALAKLVSIRTPVLQQDDGLVLYQPILSTPVALEETEARSGAQQIGAVIVKMSNLQTRKLKYRLLWFTLIGTAILLLATLYLVHLSSRHIIDPISQLSKAVQNIGAGDLETGVSVDSKIDELSTLTKGINQMRADLQHERAILQHRIDEATEQLRNLAFYDTLTLLPNRRLLLDRLALALNACKRNERYGALMFIDLDNFKPLNDQFGHAAGDLLLIEVANRIRHCVRETDTVARYGGDEFVVILNELSEARDESDTQAHIVAEKIRAALAKQYNLVFQQEGQPAVGLSHHCASSIGVALFQGKDAQDDILHDADTAMYQAKQDGRNRIHFHES